MNVIAMVFASFAGTMLALVVGGPVVLRRYTEQFEKTLVPLVKHPRPALRSQPTATTPGFVRHNGDVTVQRAQWGHSKKRIKF